MNFQRRYEGRNCLSQPCLSNVQAPKNETYTVTCCYDETFDCDQSHYQCERWFKQIRIYSGDNCGCDCTLHVICINELNPAGSPGPCYF